MIPSISCAGASAIANTPEQGEPRALEVLMGGIFGDVIVSSLRGGGNSDTAAGITAPLGSDKGSISAFYDVLVSSYLTRDAVAAWDLRTSAKG